MKWHDGRLGSGTGRFLVEMVNSSDGSVVSFHKTAVAVLASFAVFLKTAVAVVVRLWENVVVGKSGKMHKSI